MPVPPPLRFGEEYLGLIEAKIIAVIQKLQERFEKLCKSSDKSFSKERLSERLEKNFLEQKISGDATYRSIIADGILKGELTDTMVPIKDYYVPAEDGKSVKEIAKDSFLDKAVEFFYDKVTEEFTEDAIQEGAAQDDAAHEGTAQENGEDVAAILKPYFTYQKLVKEVCQIILYYKCHEKYAVKNNGILIVKAAFSACRYCYFYSSLNKAGSAKTKRIENFFESFGINKTKSIDKYSFLSVDFDMLSSTVLSPKPAIITNSIKAEERENNIKEIKKQLADILTSCL